MNDYCQGVVPLTPRSEKWMTQIMSHDWLSRALDEFGEPLNIHAVAPFLRNMGALKATAQEHGVELTPFFARKANKSLCFVEAARDNGYGVDVASLKEVQQALDTGVSPARIVCTAAVKTVPLIGLCVQRRVTIIVDNQDELEQVVSVARGHGAAARIGLRLAGFTHDGARLYSRFGFQIEELEEVLDRVAADDALLLLGLHFHLNGYDAGHRISAIRGVIPVLGKLEAMTEGRPFLDIGGGIPMNYLAEPGQLPAFLEEHDHALKGQRAPITFRNHALGRRDGGPPDAYPVAQSPVQADWLGNLLQAEISGQSVAQHLQGIDLRCEPGRSVLDGCGLTAARVVHRKTDTEGNWMIGLPMNRTQFRTGFLEVMFDPLLIPAPDRGAATPPIEGFLTGTYCMESELLYLRTLSFPRGVAIGDIIVFPNTAGYLMHFVESRSHQFDLARNVICRDNSGLPEPDPIDREGA